MHEVKTAESTRIEELERTIQENLKSFYAIGKALAEIRDSRLYKTELGYDTFEDYCRDRWDMGKDFANKQIASTKVIDNLQNEYHGIQIPASERQARPLARLSPSQQVEAWKEVLDITPDGKITARIVSSVVKKIAGGEVVKRLEHSSREVEEDPVLRFEFMNSMERMIAAINKAKAEKWRTATKMAVLRMLKSIIEYIEMEDNDV